MASFTTAVASVTFTVDRDSYDESREARVAVQDIPGGDNFYVDRAGRKPGSIKFGLLLANSTALGTLFSVLGQSGSLVVELTDTHTATLMRLGRPTPFLDGQQRTTAEFLVTV